MKKIAKTFLVLTLTTFVFFAVFSCSAVPQTEQKEPTESSSETQKPQEPAGSTENTENSKELYTVLNNNVPYFSEEDYAYAKKTGYFIELAELDELGRTGVTWGLFDYAHMPTTERETLKTNPSGWKQHKYDTSIVNGGWLYNRSHQIGFQISGLNDEPRNLMTGTREFNAPGMLQFENMTASHMRDNRDHHVLYRLTPDFHDNNLLAHGVTMESDCIECDDSADYCVYVANIQPGVTIDYATGENWLSSETPETPSGNLTLETATYILNTNSMRFHLKTCSKAPAVSSPNYELTGKSRALLIADGYSPCGVCKP